MNDRIDMRHGEAAEALSDAIWARHDHIDAMKNLFRSRSGKTISEQRLWTALEAAADGFAVFDRHARIVAANPAFFAPFEGMECVKLGITYGELVDIAVEEGLVHPGDTAPEDWARWMKGRWSRKTIPPVTVRFWSNQAVRLIERRTPSGDVVMMGINITRQARNQTALRAARRRAEARADASSAHLDAVGDKVRTAMTNFMAMADLIAAEPLTKKQRRCLDTMRLSGSEVLAIVNDGPEHTVGRSDFVTVSNEALRDVIGPDFAESSQDIPDPARHAPLRAAEPLKLADPVETDAGSETPRTEGETAEAPDAGVATDGPLEAPSRKMRVLCAEDNKTNRLILRRMLMSLDIDLMIVENGRQAVRAVRAEMPDIVFTDISMPEMDGKKLARVMRRFAKKRNLPPVPIVAMTAHTVDHRLAEIRAAGIKHCLAKPLKKDVLVKHIAAAAPKDAAPPIPPAKSGA